MRKHKLTTYHEAKPAKRQHTQPCHDCPFRRDSFPGWLGQGSVEEWLLCVHGEGRVECHTKIGPQCAGAAIYRANNCKVPRDESLLRLGKDTSKVFGSPMEFTAHHKEFKLGQ